MKIVVLLVLEHVYLVWCLADVEAYVLDVFARGIDGLGRHTESHEHTRDGGMDAGVEEAEPYQCADGEVIELAEDSHLASDIQGRETYQRPG